METFEESKKKKEKQNNLSFAGWNAISDAFEKIYPTQKNPKHYGTIIKWALGGKDPLV